MVGSAGDQWISPKGTDSLNGLIEESTDWYGFLQVLPILFIISTAVVVGLAYADGKAESRVVSPTIPDPSREDT